MFNNRLFGSKIESSIVPKDLADIRLDVYLNKQYPAFSRSHLSQLCAQKLVLVNNRTREKHFKVRPNDQINVTFISVGMTEVQPEDIPLDILYEDKDIIAVNKPVGMIVHPAPGFLNGTFVNALLFHLGNDSHQLINGIDAFDNTERASVSDPLTNTNVDDDLDLNDIDFDRSADEQIDVDEVVSSVDVPRYLRPGIVHRLDKGTSGILLAGKNIEAVYQLSNLFKNRKISKIYLAICIGHPGHTTIRDFIGRNSKYRQLMTTMKGPPGKPAVSHVHTLAFDGKLSAALIRIETGR